MTLEHRPAVAEVKSNGKNVLALRSNDYVGQTDRTEGKNFTLVQISSKVFHDVKDQHGPAPKQWYEIGVHTPAAHRVQSPAARASSCSSLHTCRTFDRRLRRPRPFDRSRALTQSRGSCDRESRPFAWHRLSVRPATRLI